MGATLSQPLSVTLGRISIAGAVVGARHRARAFMLYGGTAPVPRLGHRQSVDFDFFSRIAFDPAALVSEIPSLARAEQVQVASHTLTCRVERGGPVLVSFFGNLGLGEAAP